MATTDVATATATRPDPDPDQFMAIPGALNPPAEPPRVSRQRLIDVLERGVLGRLTVIAAGAGWGKSSALADWSAQTSSTVAWMCARPDMNSIVRFFRSMLIAIRASGAGPLDDMFAMLRSAAPHSCETIVTALLAELERIDQPLVIVIDDFHEIDDPRIHASVADLVNLGPPNVHILVASRRSLPFPVARLRVGGQLVTLDQRDLAFTPEEAAPLLSPLTGETLGQAEVQALVDRTEGWGAGLMLAGLSLSRTTDRMAAIARLGGTHRDVAEYLGEEVLAGIAPDLTSFLLQTSVLEQITADLANAVTGRADAATMIDRVVDANLFVIPLDEPGQAWRYHSLFRDLLLARLRATDPAAEDALHARAAQWLEDHGLVLEAVAQAMEAHDPATAAALIERHGERLMFICGETESVNRWILRLPPEVVDRNRELSRIRAWGLTLAGHLDNAEMVMDHIEQTVEGGPSEWLEREHAAIRSRIASYRSDHDATIGYGKKALTVIDDYATCTMTAEIMLTLGFAYRAIGQHRDAVEQFGGAIRYGRLAGNIQAARWGIRYLAEDYVQQGRLRDAHSLLNDELQQIAQSGEAPGNTIVGVLIGRAEVELEQNNLASARATLDRAIPRIQHQGDAKMLINAYTTLAMLYQAEGRAVEADDYMRRSMRILPGVLRNANLANLALIQGHADEAARWAIRSGFGLDGTVVPDGGESEQLIYTRIMVRTCGDPQGVGLATRLLERADRNGRLGRSIALRAILATTAWREGDRATTFTHLQHAISLAQPEGFVRTLVNEGPDMYAALRALVRDGDVTLAAAHRAFVLDLIAAFDGADNRSAKTMSGSPLTERQREILRLLAAGQSNRQIAEALFISEGTVKAHVHQVFNRLMARNRTEVVANARELGLLDDAGLA